MKTVIVAPEAEGVLVVEANIILRNMNLSQGHALAWNSLFKQLTGQDHESMERRAAGAIRSAFGFQEDPAQKL